ncbi:hypothetical protein BH20VER2_BH20VER2_11010 [soil metagenome]|nr:DUF1453 domain-containing protein [Chthoniobacterales bacterium]
MPLLVPAFLFLLLLALPLLMPLALVQRYRAGTARRRGRGWVATVNLVTMGISVGVFLFMAALATIWLPSAFQAALLGLAAGGLLGLLGIALTRWEHGPDGLHYTANRWLTLLVVLALATRLLYSLWRGWQNWGAAGEETSWLVAAGLAGSLGVGAAVLGYYFTYAAGVWRRVRRPRRF